jgi:glycosyltransferase involved in cell wall biosynthesis
MTSTGIPVKNKKDAKLAINVDPDSFLVLRVDRNSVRKNYADTWKALQPVMERHPEILAWFHCKPQGDGLEMPELFSRNEKTAKRFLTPGRLTTFRGWEQQDMAVLYNAADLFVSTSWGEGFGLTLGEAAACEVPIVAQNVSSIPEVVGPGGVLIEPERLITVFAGHDQWLPNVDAFSDAIEKLYSSRGARRDLGQKGRQHVLDNFSWDHAAAQFDELITGLTHRPSGGSPGGD